MVWVSGMDHRVSPQPLEIEYQTGPGYTQHFVNDGISIKYCVTTYRYPNNTLVRVKMAIGILERPRRYHNALAITHAIADAAYGVIP